jgi:pimeloyl-ACP methyl ester carboxylesterase
MGGTVAFQLALQNPELINKIVVLDSSIVRKNELIPGIYDDIKNYLKFTLSLNLGKYNMESLRYKLLTTMDGLTTR